MGRDPLGVHGPQISPSTPPTNYQMPKQDPSWCVILAEKKHKALGTRRVLGMVVFDKQAATLGLELLNQATPWHGRHLQLAAAEGQRKRTDVNVRVKFHSYLTEAGKLSWRQAWLLAYCLLNPEKVFLDEIKTKLSQISRGVPDPDNAILVGN